MPDCAELLHGPDLEPVVAALCNASPGIKTGRSTDRSIDDQPGNHLIQLRHLRLECPICGDEAQTQNGQASCVCEFKDPSTE